MDSERYRFGLQLIQSTGKESIDRVRVSDSTGTTSLTQDSDGWYTVQMGREDRMLYIDYKDSAGRSKTYKYQLHFQRGARIPRRIVSLRSRPRSKWTAPSSA